MDTRSLYARLQDLAELAARVSSRYPERDTELLTSSLRQLAAMAPADHSEDGPYRGLSAIPVTAFREASVREQAWKERARDRADLRILALEAELRELRAKVGDT